MRKAVIFLFTLILLINFVNADLSDGLTSYYDCDGDLDDLENNFEGTNSGGDTVAGINGNALSFVEGNSDYGTLGIRTELGSRSISFWVANYSDVNKGLICDRASSSYLRFGKFYSATLGMRVFGSSGATTQWGSADGGMPFYLLNKNNFQHIVIVLNATGLLVYVNGTKVYNEQPANYGYPPISDENLSIGACYHDNDFADAILDEISIWNRTLSPSEVTGLWNSGVGLFYPFGKMAPMVTSVNCTSCNPPNGDNESPYTTSDTTPTFDISTDTNAYCRIGDENQNYTDMGGSRNCTGGGGTTSHVCTLTVQDDLVNSDDIVYISCASKETLNQTSNATVALQMNITGLETNKTVALDLGIQDSVIWPGATIYSDQQVYLRDLNNNQKLTTVDRVAVYGNQRWLLNYDNETSLGLFNITPVVYVLEFVNVSISLTDMRNEVAALINTTKN